MNNQPVVIGGSGGSGTRLICQLMQSTGYNMGEDLNESLDNLLFTFLLKRPSYFNSPSDPKIARAISLFGKLTHHKPNLRELITLYRVHKSNQHSEDANESFFKKERFKNAIRKKSTKDKWGWKEPNNQIFLPQIHDCFPELKYIHVIRNGYYMASSGNQQQLINWGQWYDINNALPSTLNNCAKFWIEINSTTIKYCNNILKEKSLIVQYDNLITNSHEEILRIADFIGESSNINQIVELLDLNFSKINSSRIEDTKTKLPSNICEQIEAIHQTVGN